MAIEDGMILSRCLKASNGVQEALQRYETARLGRTSRIVQSALKRLMRAQDELADPHLGHALMDRLFKSASGDPYEWIHQYDAVNAPV
jgi:salicylate hydroxylase